MEWDDDESDDFWHAPLPPEDRLWRHPAEVAAASRLQSVVTVSTSWHRTLAVAGVSAIAGGALMASVMLQLGTSTQPQTTPDEPVLSIVASDPLFPVPEAVPETQWPVRVAETAAPAVAAVRAERDGRTIEGTGFLYRNDGHLLTSHDLVAGLSQVEVTFRDGETVHADVVGSDARSGIGLLRVQEGAPAAVVRLGLLKQPPRVGQYSLVLDGYRAAFALDVGHVTGLDARMRIDDGDDFYGLLLVDSAPVDGFAGAPLLDDAGDAIGVVIRVDDEAATYAVPIAYAIDAADDLLRYGRVHHTWLGIKGKRVADQTADDLGVPGAVLVTELRPDSPAVAAGLLEGDVIVRIDDRDVYSIEDLILELREHSATSTVTIDYFRGSDHQSVPVALRAQPS